ncbi:MAG: LacI family DNA-binding transcriptional regulator [Spirochaetales bacterium]|nr:LacI family DNA-binding transcriptional regulator [Spirochaetales bacterium]
MKPKLRDVAELAGVSITAASMALSETGRISDETRTKVLTAAAELGYQRKIKSTKITDFNHVAVLVSCDYEWAFIWKFIQPLIEQIEVELKTVDLNLIMIPISHKSTPDEIFNKIKSSSAGAVISLHFGNDKLFIRLEENGIPVIVVMKSDFHDRFYSVCVDDFQGAYEAGCHLIKLGHKKIAYVGIERPDLPALSNDRFIGFKKAMDVNHLDLPPEYVFEFEAGHMEKLKRDIYPVFNTGSEKRPTAVFCLDDDLAQRFMLALKDLTLSIPGDVSIIAPGDVLDYNMPYIRPITTMQINTTYMGKIVSQMLINRLENTPDIQHGLKVQQHLVERGSCRVMNQE